MTEKNIESVHFDVEEFKLIPDDGGIYHLSRAYNCTENGRYCCLVDRHGNRKWLQWGEKVSCFPRV